MTTAELFLYLLRCELNGVKPEPGGIPAETLTELYDLSRKHSLNALTAYALEDAGVSDPRFTEAKYQAIYKNAQLLEAGNEVCAFLEENGIRHMPLKGMLLQELYPKPGMRQMTDCDILFDIGEEEKVRDWFLRSGYTKSTGKNVVHISYFKTPVRNIEMHNRLLRDGFGWLSDIDAIWSRASLCRECRARYAFSPLDEFVYLSAHACKHLSRRGTGIRSLVDLYLYRRAHLPGLDGEILGRRLDEVKIRSSAERMIKLAEAIFSPENETRELPEEERELLEQLLDNGTYGTTERYIRNQLEKVRAEGKRAVKLRYCLKRLHADRDVLLAYPFFDRHPVFRPLLAFWRVSCALSRRPAKLKRELHYLLHDK